MFYKIDVLKNFAKFAIKHLAPNVFLKSDFYPSKKIVLLLQWKPYKVMKNAFYSILNALFVLKIFKFLSWLFGHTEKTAWLGLWG